jgi:hypothetical protein
LIDRPDFVSFVATMIVVVSVAAARSAQQASCQDTEHDSHGCLLRVRVANYQRNLLVSAREDDHGPRASA